LPLAEKPQVVVTVNEVRGTCSLSSNCAYEIDREKSKTPEIQCFSVEANGLSIDISNPGSLSFSAADITVDFAGSSCTSVNFDSLTITCVIEKNSDNSLKLIAGSHKPVIHILNIGYANYNANVANYEVSLAISSISPNSGGALGGTIVDIEGSGFSNSLIDTANLMEVKYGSAVWKILSINNKKVSLITGQKIDEGSVTITLNGKSVTTTYTYTSVGVPTITLLSPSTSSPVQKADLTITGTNFGVDSNKIKIYLDKGTNLGVYELSVVSVTDTQIICVLGGGRTGEYRVRIVKDPIGSSQAQKQGDDVFKYQFTLSSISPVKGSRYGGTLLTISGQNFSPVNNQNQVFIGPGNILCDIVSATSNEITCRTRPALETYTGQLDVVVQQRLAEDGICTGTCKFEYTAIGSAESPEVTEATISQSGEQYAGDTITLVGTNLNALTNVKPKVIFGPNNLAEVEAFCYSDTEISFLFPALPPGLSNFQLLLDGKGYAKLPQNLIYKTVFKVNSVSPTTGSQGGGLLTITGNGFNESTTVAFADASKGACVILSRTSTQITCRTDKNVNSEVRVTQFQTTLSCTGCSYQSDATKTPVITAVSPASPITPISNKISLTFTGTSLTLASITEAFLEIYDQLSASNMKFFGDIKTNTATQLVVEFTDVPAGTSYAMRILYNGLGYALFNVANTLRVALPLPTTTPVVASYNGGKKITFTGLGFITTQGQLNSNAIKVCGTICKVISSSYTSLVCEVPPLITTLSDSTYSLANTNIVPYDQFNDLNQPEYTLNDDNTGNVYTCKTSNCFAKISFGDMQYAKIDYIKFYPDITLLVVFLSDMGNIFNLYIHILIILLIYK
jgi:hypothetical protein